MRHPHRRSTEDHSQGKSKGTPKKQKAKAESQIRKRSRMEITAYILMAFAAILFAVCSGIYSSHRMPSIVIFGIGVLVTDVAVCLFWLAKTVPVKVAKQEVSLPAPDLSAMHGTLKPEPTVLFSSESSSPTVLEIGDSGSTMTWLGEQGSPMFQLEKIP